MNPQSIGSARRALYTMLGGLFFLFFHVKIGGLDILNDAIGALLLAAGAARLGAVRVNQRYVSLTGFAVAGALVLVPERLFVQLAGPGTLPPFLLLSLAALLIGLAVACFCLAMGSLWTALDDPGEARLWRAAGWIQAALVGGMALVRIGGFLPGVLSSGLPNSPSPSPATLLQTVLTILQAFLLARSHRLLGRMDAAQPIAPLADWAPRPWSRQARRAAWAAAALLIGLGGFLALRQPPQAALLREIPIDGAMMIQGGGGASFSPDGRRILSQDQGGARVRDAATGAELLAIMPYDRRIYDLAFDPSGRRIATSSRFIQIWDATDGRELLRAPPESSYDPNVRIRHSYHFRFSPDGSRLAALQGAAIVYDTATGAELIRFPGEAVADAISLAWSPDGTKLAIGGQRGQATIWDAATGREPSGWLRELQAPGDMVSALAWSPDGTKLATANDHNLAIVWDAATGREPSGWLREIVVSSELDWLLGRRPHAHPRNWTAAIAWSPDGSKLAIGSSDASAGVWDAATGRQLWRLDGHRDDVAGLSWHPDGTRLITSGREGTARVWDVSGR
ncbi:MAG TPA: WD40 repeat domain-containing protein [Herpetosiphonaceae bacterium]